MKVSRQLNAVCTNMKQVSGIIPIWVDIVRSRWSDSLIISGIHFFRKTCRDKFSIAHFSLSRKSRLDKIIINYAKHSQNILVASCEKTWSTVIKPTTYTVLQLLSPFSCLDTL